MNRDREAGLYRGRGDGSSRLQLVVQDLHQPMDCFSSDEVNSRNGGCGEEEEEEGEANDWSGSGSRPPAPAPSNGAAGGGDGPASAESGGKRRRGRRPGSKNKPKPPPVVTRDVEPAAAMRPHVLEIPTGGDVARALAGFARRRGLGICVLAGTGAVGDVSLRHPAPAASSADGGAPPAGAAAVVVFRGRYEILSISATFLAPSMSAAVPARAAVSRDLSISLAGPHGQIVGGAVVGPLVAATTVVVLAAAFTDLTFHRLPLEDDAPPASVCGSGEAPDEHRGRHGHQPPPEHHDASGLHPQTMVAPATQPVPLYARQSQELWPPAASAQRPRPPPYQ